MGDQIISHFSFKSITSSVVLPVHDPISFDFENIIKLKAELEQIRKRMPERGGFTDEGVKGDVRTVSDNAADAFDGEYVYNYDLIAELALLKQKKKLRLGT